MARGFLKGAVWGSAVSICVLGVVSTFADRSQTADVTLAAPEAAIVPQEQEATAAVDEAVPSTDQTEPLSEPDIASQDQETTPDAEKPVPVTGQPIPAPQPDTLAAVPEAVMAPAAQPETGAASDLADPDVETATPDIDTTTGETPVVPAERTTGLQAPSVEPSVTVSTDPAQPATPSANSEIALSVDPVQPVPPSGDESAFGDVSEAEAPESAPGVSTSISQDPDQPKAPAVPSETQAFETPGPEAETAQAQQSQPSMSPVTSPDSPVSEEITVSPVIGTAPVPQIGSGPFDAEPAPQPQSDPLPEDQMLALKGSEGTVGNLAPEVEVNRLPTLAGDADGDATGEISEAGQTNEGAARALRPVEKFAAAFDNTGDKPVMAIVLMDEGVNLSRDTIGLPALRSFPYPISFAVDTNLPDAQDRMAAYRAEGFEVLALIDLPSGATARDAEVTLAAALEMVPEAVGVLEGVGEGLQGTRDAAEQVTEILAQTGHGFVTQNQGLNTVQKLAAKSGVPSAVVFRDFDSAEQTPTVIRRFLDQAAFKAGREGGVIMLGRLREDTISALLIWGLQDRAKTVALVPVSAALQSQ
ncbi:MAG: divergent polysaccharide deacetylase family protein [Paracoccaceae bacterium]|nr:divergent polysaccharide deacetylase family protein [Paracoccaceae bacterium]